MEKGQYVICIGDSKTCKVLDKDSYGWSKNRIFKINEVTIYDEYSILWPKDTIHGGVYNYPDHIRLATPKEINNFLPINHPDRIESHYEIY